MGPQIRRLLSDDCARINCHLPRPISEEFIYSHARIFASEIERELPSIAEEIRGLAEGAEISYEQATLLQVRREVLMQIQKGSGSDCSSITLPISQRIVAQTIDLNSSFAEFGTALQIAPWGGTPEILMYSFAGLLGYLGMNSSGLAIAINMVSSDGWQPGVPPYLLVRRLLELHTIEDCIDAIANIRRSSSRSLTICDAKRSVIVEMTATSFAVLEGSELFHTNHYLSEDFTAKDTVNFLAKRSSMARLSRLQALTERLPASPDVSDLFQLFADHQNHPVGLCSHADGDKRRTETVATVVMHPSSGTMYVRKGLACSAHPIDKYSLASQSDMTPDMQLS